MDLTIKESNITRSKESETLKNLIKNSFLINKNFYRPNKPNRHNRSK